MVSDVVERLKGRRCKLETPTKTDYLRADSRPFSALALALKLALIEGVKVEN